jgi:hypothetical protein
MPMMTPSWSLVFENRFVSDLVESSPEIDRTVSRCAARRLVDDPALVALLDDAEGTDATWDAYVDAGDRLLAECEANGSARADR